MARGGVVSILLMILSLGVLLVVAGTISAAAVSGTIRLPSSSDVRGVADLVTAMATTRHGNGERPWDCSDKTLCEKTTYPPFCRCMDTVDRCSDACKDCEELEDSRYICKDWYWGAPGPRCGDEDGNSGDMNIIRLPDDIELGPERMAVLRGARNKGQKRPWKCCDKAVPGPTTQGTVWYCMDKVERCTCDRCYKLKDSHSYYYCLDGYQSSDPGPTCSHA